MGSLDNSIDQTDVPSSPVVAGGFVYVGTQNGHLDAFQADASHRCNAETPPHCQPLWSNGTISGGFTSTPAVVNGVVYIGGTKSQVSRICARLDVQVDAFRNRPLGHIEFPYVYLDATYVKARDTDLHQVVSRAVVIATGITANGDREVLGLAWAIPKTNRSGPSSSDRYVVVGSPASAS